MVTTKTGSSLLSGGVLLYLLGGFLPGCPEGRSPTNSSATSDEGLAPPIICRSKNITTDLGSLISINVFIIFFVYYKLIYQLYYIVIAFHVSDRSPATRPNTPTPDFPEYVRGYASRPANAVSIILISIGIIICHTVLL